MPIAQKDQLDRMREKRTRSNIVGSVNGSRPVAAVRADVRQDSRIPVAEARSRRK